MRAVIALFTSILLVACAESRSPPPRVPEVPMYTAVEWSEMTRTTTVPEIADNTALKIDSLGSSHFGMHVHTHHFHMHVHH